MPKAKGHQFIRDKMHELLDPVFAGIEIEVGRSERWQRTQLIFRHAAFADWLPEQRFRRLTQLIPPEFFERHLRGAVWFELAPGETEDDLLQVRRSEDMADDEPAIARQLFQVNFFDVLEQEMGDSPIESCDGAFTKARKVLAANKIVGPNQDDACLVFIRNQAYCDCEVLLAAKPALAERYGDD